VALKAQFKLATTCRNLSTRTKNVFNSC